MEAPANVPICLCVFKKPIDPYKVSVPIKRGEEEEENI